MLFYNKPLRYVFINPKKKLDFRKKKDDGPQSVADIASKTTDPQSFTKHLHSWQLWLQKISSKTKFLKSIEEPPEYLSLKINDKGECDAYLAAYTEWLCLTHDLEAPDWTQEPLRTALDPWFDPSSDLTEARLSFETHPSFKNRNLFTVAENVLTLRRGHPRKSNTELQQSNAERQQRFRDRRRKKWMAYKNGEVQPTRIGNDFMQVWQGWGLSKRATNQL